MQYTPYDGFDKHVGGLALESLAFWLTARGETPRSTESGEARRGSILDIFDREATQLRRDVSPLDCSGAFATGCYAPDRPPLCREPAGQHNDSGVEIRPAAVVDVCRCEALHAMDLKKLER